MSYSCPTCKRFFYSIDWCDRCQKLLQHVCDKVEMTRVSVEFHYKNGSRSAKVYAHICQECGEIKDNYIWME